MITTGIKVTFLVLYIREKYSIVKIETGRCVFPNKIDVFIGQNVCSGTWTLKKMTTQG